MLKILNKYKNKTLKEIALSIYYSIKYKPNKFYNIPIVNNGICKIKKNKNGKLVIEKRLRLNGEVSALCKNKSSLDIRKNSELEIRGSVNLGAGTNIVVNDNAKVIIGNNSYIAGDSKIYAKNLISIGNNCALSWGITIIDTDFHNITYNLKESNIISKPIKICDNVWIG